MTEAEVVVGAEHGEDLAHLVHRRSGGRLDGGQRGDCRVGVVAADEAAGAGLHGDHAHRVGEDVVQLVGDAQPLLGDGASGLLLALTLQVGGALFELGDEQAPGAHVVAEQPAAGDEHDGVHFGGTGGDRRRHPRGHDGDDQHQPRPSSVEPGGRRVDDERDRRRGHRRVLAGGVDHPTDERDRQRRFDGTAAQCDRRVDDHDEHRCEHVRIVGVGRPVGSAAYRITQPSAIAATATAASMATRVAGPGPPATTDHVCDGTEARFAASSLSSSTRGYCRRLINNHAPARRRHAARPYRRHQRASIPDPPETRGHRSMSVIAFDGLTKRFGDVVAVDDLTVELAPGRVVGLLGPNGAGKTTTLRMLLGLVAPTAGSATIDGRPYRDLDDPIRHIGAVLEATSFHPGRRAREHLRVLAATADLPDDRVDEVLADVALTGVARRRVGGFSLGMRQRLGLAAALLGEPEILVLDEPTNGLDPEGVRWLRDFVRGYAAAGRTVLVSSHLLAEVAQTVDDVVVLVAGRLVAHAPLSELAGFAPVGARPHPAGHRVARRTRRPRHRSRTGEPRPRARPRRHHRDGRTGHRRRRPRRLRDRPGPHRLGTGLPRPHHHAATGARR